MMKRTSLWIFLFGALAVFMGFNQSGEVSVPPDLRSAALDHSRSSCPGNAPAGLPLYFSENKGQADEAIKYILQTQQGNIFFTPQEIVFQFIFPLAGGTTPHDRIPAPGQEKRTLAGAILRAQFLGACQDVTVEAVSESGARINDLRGRDPETRVKGARTYEKLLYSNLYPGIDLLTSGHLHEFSRHTRSL
jgi:hypothetical protein